VCGRTEKRDLKREGVVVIWWWVEKDGVEAVVGVFGRAAEGR
jgi:hypothetical protein